MTARARFAAMIVDESNKPITLLGAAVSFLRMQEPAPWGRRIADAVDAAIKAEIKTIQNEAGNVLSGSPLP